MRLYIPGKEFTEDIGMRSNPETKADTYDPTVNAAIANVFAACAFRFAHTLLPVSKIYLEVIQWLNFRI